MIASGHIAGLVPAAGEATRLSLLPCSKEIFPVGFHSEDITFRPKVVSQYLLDSMRTAGIKKAYIIIRDGKWDIPSYYGDGEAIDMHIAYLMMNLPYGVPYTLDQAYPFVKEYILVLGFPDMIFEPVDAYRKLIERFQSSNAEMVLGLFPAHRPHKTDMVELDDNGVIKSIVIKPENSNLTYAWEIAVWSPTFTEFMHKYLKDKKREYESAHNGGNNAASELHFGDIIQEAIREKILIDSVLFEKGSCIDVGTPEDLLSSVKQSCSIFSEDKE